MKSIIVLIVLLIGCTAPSVQNQHCGKIEYKDGVFHNPWGEPLSVMVSRDSTGILFFKIPACGEQSYKPKSGYQVHFYNSHGLVGFMRF